MKRRTVVIAMALTAGLSLVVTACGDAPGNVAVGYDTGTYDVVNASNHTGGTVDYVMSGTPDSTDPGATYTNAMRDFSRLYARPLLTYAAAPGVGGLRLQPDLATGAGQVSADGLTWTYHLRSGAKFEDGTPVSSKDVKYAIERSAGYVSPGQSSSASYFQQYLTDPGYPGAYQDPTPDKMGLTAIDTPDDTTLVFHLQKPFADFDYLMTLPQTAPVPPAKDTGPNYRTHPISSGPYMFASYDANTGFTLVRNPNWDARTDPIGRQLADRIVVKYNVGGQDNQVVDNQLISGAADLDLSGAGAGVTAQAQILASSDLQKNADDPLTGALWYAALDTQVGPLTNVDCRRAVEYAVDKVADQAAYGGPVSGGTIASTALPPNILGYTDFDYYEASAKPHGDPDKAKIELGMCGQPGGFSTNLAARSDNPQEMAAAKAIQQALAQVGVTVNILSYPTAQYASTAGSPNFVHQNNIGILLSNWTGSWPDGFGFVDQLVNGNAIRPAGNTNLSEENNPQINALLGRATSTSDPTARNGMFGDTDELLMGDAAIIPMVDSKALLYRNPNASNVYVSPAYGMFDYAQIGVLK
jgi:peptide/nickel transport system substrate-binding protein